MMELKLPLSPEKIDLARTLAGEITAPIKKMIQINTTVTVERSTPIFLLMHWETGLLTAQPASILMVGCRPI